MEHHGGRRSRAERDAVTVEIGYALFSAAFAAAVLFGAVAGPAYVFGLPAGVRSTLIGCGTTVAAVAFVARVVGVLLRFQRSAQPGRTGPDA
ncbi:DUF6332 family protein [Streptomyces sp. NPDC006134]|uniref:DUF6332 family protein n=1 Tax=Streptomyces sp. NPDC006134 TaxID=3154467 RepID=UPI0033CBEAAD